MPRVFISYAHGSADHEEAVRDLWIFLRRHGVDAKLDRSAAGRRQDWALWMGDQVREADHVLIIASDSYRERAEGRTSADEGRGVQFEARLIRDAFYRDPKALDRFLPVVLPGQSVEGIPDFLAPASSTVYRIAELSPTGAESLLRLLLGQPADEEPPLGDVPILSRQVVVSATSHEITLNLTTTDSGVRTETVLAGTPLGEHAAPLPAGLASWQAELRSPSGEDRLTELGHALWRTLLDEPTGRRLHTLISGSPLGSTFTVVVRLSDELSWLPVELLRLPDGRLAATVPGVRFSRRFDGLDRPATPALPGPLKILAAVAAPDESTTSTASLDVEAEMQALLDAVTDLEGGAQVRILEVASLTEIGRALAADQYHVLHLCAHGSADTIELEDEVGQAVSADADSLVAALRAGERPLPLVVLSSCRGAETGTAGMAATLVRHGADRVIAMQAPISDGFATRLARELYRVLAETPRATAGQALAAARRSALEDIGDSDHPALPEFAVPTLLSGSADLPLRNPALPQQPLPRETVPSTGNGVRELPIGQLIGRRSALRAAAAVLRRNSQDRERYGDWSGLALTGVGGIGKTAVAGRILARAREAGWAIAEHVGVWSPANLIAAVAAALPHIPALRDDRPDDEKFSLVLAALRECRLVILFDDFEQNLTTDGEFTDLGFAEIFERLCDSVGEGRLLLTSRYPVADAELTLLRVELSALSSAELSRLVLRMPALRKLSTEDRTLVARTIGGHPRLTEFLDVLLRHTPSASFRHVTTKLRHLAKTAGIDLKAGRDVSEAIADVVRLGSRDILLDALYAELTPGQKDFALVASLCRASLSIENFAHTRHGAEATATQVAEVRADANRLCDLTLLSGAADGRFTMHPWIAASLARYQTAEERMARHERARDMRMHDLDSGLATADDLIDVTLHAAGCHDYDFTVEALAFGSQALGAISRAALLAEVVPLIPTDHVDYLALVELECDVLTSLGLVSATMARRSTMLSISKLRADAHPEDIGGLVLVSACHDRLGQLALVLGDTSSAEEHFQSALDIARTLAAAHPADAERRYDLARAFSRMGELARNRIDSATAEMHFQAACDIERELLADDPDNDLYQYTLCTMLAKLAKYVWRRGDRASAESLLHECGTISAKLVEDQPQVIEYQRLLMETHGLLGELKESAGDFASANSYYQSGLLLSERLAESDPHNVTYVRDISVAHSRLATLSEATGDWTAAESHTRSALAIMEKLAELDPGNALNASHLCFLHTELGDLLRAQQNHDTAQKHFVASLHISEQLIVAEPANRRYRLIISRAHSGLATSLLATDAIAGEKFLRKWLAISERLSLEEPDDALCLSDLSKIHWMLAHTAIAFNQSSAARAHFEESLECLERASTLEPAYSNESRRNQIVQSLADLDSDGEQT
ncbi:CHAT domain-containing protein [Lentzea sp. NPDC054927]